MHVMIIGAAGMIGRKLANKIAETSGLGGEQVQHLSLVDVFEPSAPDGFSGKVSLHKTDPSQDGRAGELISNRPDVIFHLASIVSGEAEVEFEKGYRVNLGSTTNLLEAIRIEAEASPYQPRFVFASSVAVFGAPLPDVIGDDYHLTPLSSYGTQKAICELLLNDYSRKGFIDGVGIRLPTICIRPGLPNKAASSFFSGILREPLAGKTSILPVDDSLRHSHASPRAAVGFLIRAASMDTAKLGGWRNLNMPGYSATVREQIDALERVAGLETVALIRREPDPAINAIVGGWPQSLGAERAKALGFIAEQNFDEIIQIYIDDELGGSLPS
ncbi:MAG: D-erythronate dehydrogenase [Paracoccaceae bacterium]